MFLLIFFIILSILGINSILEYQDIVKHREKLILQTAENRTKFLHEIERMGQEHLNIALTIANIIQVKQYLSERNRVMLYQYIYDIHTHINKNYPFALRIHFHIPPAKSFLRMWKPEKFNDDLSGFRQTVMDVLQQGKPLRGLEAGRLGLLVRGIAPVFGKSADPAGSVEVYSHVEEVAENISEKFGDKNAVYRIEKVKAIFLENEQRKTGRFVESVAPPESLRPFITEDMLEQALEKPMTREAGNILITAASLRDYSNEPIGVYLQFTDISDVKNMIKSSLNRLFFLTVFFLILFSAVTYPVLRSVIQPISHIIRGLNEAANQVAVHAERIESGSKTTAQGAVNQTASVAQIAASFHKARSLSRENAENAQGAGDIMEKTAKAMAGAGHSFKDIADFMKEIYESGRQSSGVIKTIDEIAFQTNMLALNAAVEAARAGDSGSGFAIVAQEVRNLSMKTAEAAQNTARLIEVSLQKSQGGKKLVKTAGSSFSLAEESSREIKKIVGEITRASEYQAAEIEKMTNHINEIDGVTRENARQADIFASASEEMNDYARKMKQFAGQLRILIQSDGDFPEK
ncbi:MAG: methyl-accepting chemotaxis protein [Desulfococcaceae bacterium]|nr:methyl-accepting chemotaxis protein [Desulfococcaceae bacterium]